MTRRRDELVDAYFPTKGQRKQNAQKKDGDLSGSWRPVSKLTKSLQLELRKQPVRQAAVKGKEKLAIVNSLLLHNLDVNDGLQKNRTAVRAKCYPTDGSKAATSRSVSPPKSLDIAVDDQKDMLVESDSENNVDKFECDSATRMSPMVKTDALNKVAGNIAVTPQPEKSKNNLSLAVDLLLKHAFLMSNEVMAQFKEASNALASVEQDCIELRDSVQALNQLDIDPQTPL